MPNHLWSIAFGDYDLTVDRRDRTFRLVETKTGTVWADGLSLGWVALENRETGEVTRHAFGELKTFSVSEKSGAQGKRILFGLDVHGVPVDVYVIAAQREIQLIVEANRDSKTHKVAGFGLVPGVCSVPDDGASYLVFPHGTGKILYASGLPSHEFNSHLPIWEPYIGLTMPFVGSIRGNGEDRTALGLYTDSAYGEFQLRRLSQNAAALDIEYRRDPERRRLDLRIVPLPGGDHIAVARAYRAKVIDQGGHRTLRKRMRENPKIETLVGSAFINCPVGLPEISELVATVRDAGVDRAYFHLSTQNAAQEGIQAILDAGYFVCGEGIILQEEATQQEADEQSDELSDPFDMGAPSNPTHAFHSLRVTAIDMGSAEYRFSYDSTWEEMDGHLRQFSQAKSDFPVVGTLYGMGDWGLIALDFCNANNAMWDHGYDDLIETTYPVPLSSIIYHDAVVAYRGIENHPTDAYNAAFLSALISLNLPDYDPWYASGFADCVARTFGVLGFLHRLTFPAFLTAHRFLTTDFKVEEAVYSDKTRIVVNRSESDTYEGDDLTLPPLGFYVRHAQMEAHDALRIGERTFEARAWRIARSRDGKPLEQSADVEHREFPV